MSRSFMSKPSTKYKQAVSALRELLQEEDEDAVARAFAEAACDARRKAFIEKYDIKTSNTDHVCVYRLLGKRCQSDKCSSPQMIPAADHCSEWKKDGKTSIIMSQPYGLCYNHLKETVVFCEEYGIEANIGAWPSWHFPGSVISVEYKLKKG